jgi:hypothetical protein
MLLFAVGLSMAPAVSAADLVKICDIGIAKRQRVEVLRESPIGSTYVYSTRHGGMVTPFFGGPEQSRGDSVSMRCVGIYAQALIVWGEFTANALQGFVLLSPPGGASVERLDFAEKVPPARLYLGRREVVVAFPTMGLGETNARYVLYRHAFGLHGGDQVEASNVLPSPTGFEVIQLEQSEQIGSKSAM